MVEDLQHLDATCSRVRCAYPGYEATMAVLYCYFSGCLTWPSPRTTKRSTVSASSPIGP